MSKEKIKIGWFGFHFNIFSSIFKESIQVYKKEYAEKLIIITSIVLMNITFQYFFSKDTKTVDVHICEYVETNNMLTNDQRVQKSIQLFNSILDLVNFSAVKDEWIGDLHEEIKFDTKGRNYSRWRINTIYIRKILILLFSLMTIKIMEYTDKIRTNLSIWK